MKAIKGNKVYTVDETSAQTYQNQGFDLYDDNGELIAYGAGKTVSYEKYMEAVDEIRQLKKEKEELARQVKQMETTDEAKAEPGKRANTKKVSE